MDAVAARRRRARRAGRHHLRRRDRQDRGPRGQPWSGRQPRRRAARHPADRRRHHGQHQARHGAHRSHPVHRRRRVSRLEAVGSDSRAAGPLPDSRRARGARAGRVRAHPHRAAERADQAVHRADGDRRRRAARSPTTASASIAEFATIVNERTENIGARRLHTVMERLLDEVSFDAPKLADKSITIDARLRAPHARRHRQERRPVPLHPVTHSTRDSRAARVNRSLRAAALSWRLALPRCGKKGPPLAPFAARAGDGGEPDRAARRQTTSTCRSRCRTTNVDGQQPADIASLEVYAVTADAAAGHRGAT